ncbi:GRP family sugar transporter [Pontiella sulfatireligans]|uniref:Glucose uptake protein GlcU n=1 Tax=Pontiella sulfatireligans TaxID=2750658 RepID=A0A6C2UHH2_9BACT|nr:GRP family sugar transporter [Pontiella sulfatireligans]VGO19578.1 Glucose uptake protein GlcU [Pontiella sulfatireligans]
MSILGIVYAVVTVFAWGTWLAPSQNVPFKGQQVRTFYVTLAVMLLALIASAFVGMEGLNSSTFWFPVLGGLIWALSGWSAFVGASRMGMAKAFGIWAPMNIVVAIVWGAVLFGEFMSMEFSVLATAVISLLVIIGGILLIVFAGSGDESAKNKGGVLGLLGAMGAGVGFATFFIPIQIGTANNPDFNMWIGTLPLSIGMFAGACVLMLITKSSPKLEKGSDYLRVMSSGVLWGLGNYGALAMMEVIGTGKGFTIAQLCVVVNALVGVFVMKEPDPKSKAAKQTLLGVLIAVVGAVVLGNIK